MSWRRPDEWDKPIPPILTNAIFHAAAKIAAAYADIDPATRLNIAHHLFAFVTVARIGGPASLNVLRFLGTEGNGRTDKERAATRAVQSLFPLFVQAANGRSRRVEFAPYTAPKALAMTTRRRRVVM